MNLDDLKNVDFKNVAALPLAIKGVLLLGMLVAVVFAGGWFVWKPMFDDLNAAKNVEWGADQRSGLRGEYEIKLAKAAGLAGYVAQLKEAEQKTNILLKQLPEKSQIDGLLTDINQAGVGRGLEFELFKPSAEKTAQLYAELPINIRVVGSYHDLGSFAADVAKMPRIVTLSELSISGGGAGKDGKSTAKDSKSTSQGKLVMEAVAKTFRALDKNEVPAVSDKKKPGVKQTVDAPKGGH